MKMRVLRSMPLFVALATAIAVAGWSGFADSANAQSLVERYRSARFKAQADRVLTGFQAQPMSVVRLAYPTDSLREWVELVFPPVKGPQEPVKPALTVTRWELVPKLARPWFRNKFIDTRWAYVGSNSISTLDTTFTRDLRARLEAEFGSPTQTIADLDPSKALGATEYIQFEYWFVLNDSIPLMVMDVNGPFERGLVVASDQKYRHVLSDVKEIFLGRLTRTEERAAYADYYFLPEQRLWFLTGYDGEKYFVHRISRPDLKLGRPLRRSERN